MNLIKYCQLISDVVSKGGTGWNAPRVSDWIVSGTGGTTVSGTFPGVEIGISTGTVELALYHRTARLPVILEGFGGGVVAGLSIGLPAGITYAGGELGVEGFSLGPGMNLPSGGIGSLIAGPKARGVISPNDLVTSERATEVAMVTLISGAAGTQAQYSIGVAIFADRPIVDFVDLAYTKAIALVYGMQFQVGDAISAGLSAMYFAIRIRNSSLPFPGARYGASVMPT